MMADRGDDAGAVFAALADPTRRRIVYELSADGPLTATQLAARVGISRQATSKHLLELADAGLATSERVGRRQGSSSIPVRSPRPRPGCARSAPTGTAVCKD